MPKILTQSNPFCNNFHVHARALTNDRNLKIVWKKMPPGAAAGYDYEKNTIFMPAVNVPMLTETEKAKLMALSYHERKHHALTDCKLVTDALKYNSDWDPKTNPKGRPNMLLKDLFNCIEDARIEMCPHYHLPGDHEDLLFYRTVLLKKDENYNEPIWSQLQIQNPYGSIMMGYIFMLPEYFTLIYSDELKKNFEIGWKILNDGRFHDAVQMGKEGSHVALALAKEIIEAWDFPEDYKSDAQQMIGDGGGDGDGEGGAGGKYVNFDDLPEGLKKLLKYIHDQEKEDGKYSVDPDQLNKEMGEMSRGEASTGPMGKICNPLMNKIDDSEVYVPYDPHDRTVWAKPYPESYQKIKSEISLKISATKNSLTKILIALSRDEITNCQKTGKLDRRRFSRVLAGSDRIFYKKRDAITIKSAVQLVIDLSGSMSGNRAELASQVATLFGETLHSLNVPFEIIGFNTDSLPYGERDEAARSGYTRCGDIINRWIFKEFNENFNNTKDRLGACAHHMDETSDKKNCGAVGGCNIDHEVILWGAYRLWRQPVDRKIQIVISDGLPSGFSHSYGGYLPRMLKLTNEKIENNGIEQFCFGIMCEEVQHYYSKYKVIFNLDEMNTEALKFLESSLRFGKR